MTFNNPLVSISVLTFNRRELLGELLEELDALTYSPLEIVVVDNHSEDDTQDYVASRFSRVKCIRTDRNLGAGGRNVGMRAAGGAIIVTLDDDVRGLDDRSIYNLVTRFAEDQRLGAINFHVANESGITCNWVHHCKEEEYWDKEFATYEITEGAVAFRKEALELSGYYPDSFFLSHEGPDLAFRIIESSFKVIYCPDVAVRHSFAQQGRLSWRNYYYDTRNQLWLAARNFPISYAVTYLGRGLPSMLVYSLRDGFFVFWLKGVAHGVAGLRRALTERRVLSGATMRMIRTIDSQRPSVAYLIRKRLFTKDGLLMK